MRKTRREFLAASAGAVAALALPQAAWPRRSGPSTGAGFASFVSEPSLEIPTLTVHTFDTPSPGYLFATTLTGPGQRGPLIFDNHGQPVWFRRTKNVAIDFRRQIYKGKPVLTWWEGTISNIGTGQGVGKIFDSSYKQIAEVKAGNGLQADVHEFLITPQNTALITIYNEVTRDLSSIGGPAAHPTLDSIFQEVDIATGKVLLEWHSLDQIPLSDSYSPILTPFDYFHINSVDVVPDGNFLVSARNTWGVYKIDRKTGALIWRLGGKSSDFQLGPGVLFMYQHDARAHTDGTITLYDDGPGDASHQSRAIRIGVDERSRSVNLLQEYPHPTALASTAMGNAQFLSNDSVVVGWGTEPWITEFDALGDVRFDASFDGGAWNYRAYRDTWVGRPNHAPSIGRRGRTVYASFNGSTDTAFWQLQGGPNRRALSPLKTVPKTGFETAIAIPGRPAFVAVTALDAAKRRLSTSRALRVV
ncbi:MAG TPA: arylsulfotransferase family protein [Gaiellaceae bacterium]|nr:arylsulfotransferase family protein [Gaiellaceae bacterium]